MNFKLKQAELDLAIEQMKESTVINESNIALFFDCYTPDDQVEQILSGNKFIRLNRGHGDYAVVEISDISAELAADHDFTIELIDSSLKGGFNASELIAERLRKTIKAELAQIKVDFIDLLTGA
ncbi:hypothetical protein [Pseudoalteromonas sp.]|uniref:hypothetical protein n=1 Tax=Pseudoalteromonas sp. TaxID=53249 RepID=UPI003D145168